MECSNLFLGKRSRSNFSNLGMYAISAPIRIWEGNGLAPNMRSMMKQRCSSESQIVKPSPVSERYGANKFVCLDDEMFKSNILESEFPRRAKLIY